MVERSEVTEGQYEIARMNLEFTGKILLFKGLAIETSETYSDFRSVSSNLTFTQGLALLEKEQALLAQKQEQK